MQKFNVYCRYYSKFLQRALTDFGADVSFKEAAEKMKEHYGLEIPVSMILKITEEHAKKINEMKISTVTEAAKCLIIEMDGGMVPIVEVDDKIKGIDLRKTRKVIWKEAKLCFARVNQEIDRIYAAVIGSPKEAGEKLYECAKKAGLAEKTYIHALADGAPWIVDQIENQFGSQAHFLIDFFHMSEYLSEASQYCSVLNPKEWLEKRKKMMKSGEEKTVFNELKNKLIELTDLPKDNGLKKCMNYMKKRLQYMNYSKAKEKKLPIGSGEIESSHRHIVQKRLKIAGAWWKSDNANAMLQLRTARANGYWEAYWDAKKRVA